MKSSTFATATTLVAGLLFAEPVLAAQCSLGILADLPVTMAGLRASVPVKINNHETNLWLDSGAFFSIMPRAKATELELQIGPVPIEGFYIIGIGGTASTEYTTIKSFGLAKTDLRNVGFLVGGSDAGNGLIGRNILGIEDTEFDLAHGSVKLVRSRDCGNSGLAYWAAGNPFFTVPLETGSNPRDHIFRLPISINGSKVEAEIDTGAPTSLLSRRAAERAGIDLSDPRVVAVSNIGGLGRHFEKGWVVPVENVSIGDEQILRSHLEVIDGPIAKAEDAPEMLLGADFVLAHHIYVARGQHRIYFTYSGGKPFITSTSADPAATTTSQAPMNLPSGTQRVQTVDSTAAQPKTADEFARRGNARLAQRAFSGAVADLSEAIRLAPNTAAYYRDRARAYGESGRGTLGRADLQKALDLEPNNGELLRARAFMRFAENDRAGALSDAEAASKVTPPTSLEAVPVAVLFERLNQPARAIAIYDAVIAEHRQDSKLGELLNGRCWVRALANDELDKALDDCNRAIKRDGATAENLDSRGLVYFRKKDFVPAMADYDAALKLNPNLAWSLYMRGLAKIALGQTAAGMDDQTAARAIRSDISDEASSYGIGR